MDGNYITEHLKKLCEFWYFGTPFAKASKDGMKYVFGTKDENGKIKYKNSITKAVAIYLCINKLPNNGKGKGSK
jgi:hypothetical protein